MARELVQLLREALGKKTPWPRSVRGCAIVLMVMCICRKPGWEGVGQGIIVALAVLAIAFLTEVIDIWLLKIRHAVQATLEYEDRQRERKRSEVAPTHHEAENDPAISGTAAVDRAEISFDDAPATR